MTVPNQNFSGRTTLTEIMNDDLQAVADREAQLAAAGIATTPAQEATPTPLAERDVVLPPAGALGGNVDMTEKGHLEEVDPHTAEPLGALGLHGEGIDQPQ